jgi:hypothetical protein
MTKDDLVSKDTALKMAIEALSQDEGWFEPEKAIQACKEALEQPAQEVKVLYEKNGIQTCEILPAPSWQGLSDDEIWDIANFLGKNKEWDYPVMFAKTIEQALKEKNT